VKVDAVCDTMEAKGYTFRRAPSLMPSLDAGTVLTTISHQETIEDTDL
jgi:hypothetical protein